MDVLWFQLPKRAGDTQHVIHWHFSALNGFKLFCSLLSLFQSPSYGSAVRRPFLAASSRRPRLTFDE